MHKALAGTYSTTGEKKRREGRKRKGNASEHKRTNDAAPV
jgi:hypothetical protein